MQAIRFVGVGRPARVEDVPKPSPGPGQIVIKIGGAGVCHSDLHAGWVSALGEGGTGFKEGDAVADASEAAERITGRAVLVPS